MAESTYDFIVVGAGPAGCTTAWRLANSSKRPSVLLLEAGGDNASKDLRISGERWLSKFNPDLNWGFKTTAQTEVDGRAIDYDRGRGLGGSSAINFGVWNVGPKGDHDEIARLTGDDDWKWENARERYNRIENIHTFETDTLTELARYHAPKAENHGKKGLINLGYAAQVEPMVLTWLKIWEKAGYDLRPDAGDGSGLGLELTVSSAHKGIRSTAADLVAERGENLKVLANAPVRRVVFDGKKATGIELIDGTVIKANKEIVISAGTLDTPKILLHSGIGPSEQLKKFGISVVHENSAVGQNLCDHIHIIPTWELKDPPSTRDIWYHSTPEERAAAVDQWKKDGSGPLADICTTHALGMFKSPGVLGSTEFKDLPDETKRFLNQPTIPSYEVILGGPAIEQLAAPEKAPSLASVFVFLLNGQSRGSVELQSADPKEPALFNPNFLSHPYDRRVAIEALKEVLAVVESPDFKSKVVGSGSISGIPKSNSEEDILDYWKKTLGSTWHMTGTSKVGKSEKEGAVVDTGFRVHGVQGVRVADMSVVPFVPNNHTQTTAYLVGLMMGDKLVKEYNLDA